MRHGEHLRWEQAPSLRPGSDRDAGDRDACNAVERSAAPAGRRAARPAGARAHGQVRIPPRYVLAGYCSLLLASAAALPSRAPARYSLRTLSYLRGGMPLPHYVPFSSESDEVEDPQASREYVRELRERADEIKRQFPNSAGAVALNGSVLENQPLCVTPEDFERLGIDPSVPQLLPHGALTQGTVKLMRGQEVTDMVLREAAKRQDLSGPVNMSDPMVQLAHQLAGYRPEGAVQTISSDNITELGLQLDDTWLQSTSDARRNRTYLVCNLAGNPHLFAHSIRSHQAACEVGHI